ncbi:hypothetical protein [Streptomyces sp. NPDC087300]|uniref:hypothetical protein n=1 Tax=Streptomyces sp. NPDC087300 TaxID=3365780 RepID=UPI003811A946
MAGTSTSISAKMAGTQTGNPTPPHMRNEPPEDGKNDPKPKSGSVVVREKVAAPERRALPDESMPVAEQVPLIDAALRDISNQAQAAEEQLYRASADAIGPWLVRAHGVKAHTYLTDTAGKPFRSFARYVKVNHGISRSTAERIMERTLVMDALGSATHPPVTLTVKQVDVLYPVLDGHGREAAVKVWEAAFASRDGVTPASLAFHRDQLGYGPRVDEGGPSVPPVARQLEKFVRGVTEADIEVATETHPQFAEWLYEQLGASLEKRRARSAKVEVDRA